MPTTPQHSDSSFDSRVALHNAGDDPEVLAIVVGMFLEQMDERFALIEGTLARGDVEGFERATHALKGTAATLALERVRSLAASLEEMATSGRMGDASGGVAELSNALDEVRPALQALVASTG